MKKKNGNGNQLAVTGPSLLSILQEVANRGVTSENVEVVERMMGMYERAQALEAEKAFTAAFNELQKEIPKIKASVAVNGNDGTVRYRYEPLHKIDKQLRPLALKAGFTYWFAEAPIQPENKVSKILTIQHVGGHKRSNQFTVRVSGPPGTNASQADGSTHSYAKRGALCDGFGIIIEHDDDARNESGPISKDQAAELRQRVRELDVDETAFLNYAGIKELKGPIAESYEKISGTKFDFLMRALDRKAMGKKPGEQGGLL